jgi:hypothetical protein
MSAATIDRRLQPFRLQLVRGFGATKPGSLLKSQVPVRTWMPWDEQRVGFLEIDLVTCSSRPTWLALAGAACFSSISRWVWVRCYWRHSRCLNRAPQARGWTWSARA